jgi:hypothetical protein
MWFVAVLGTYQTPIPSIQDFQLVVKQLVKFSALPDPVFTSKIISV